MTTKRARHVAPTVTHVSGFLRIWINLITASHHLYYCCPTEFVSWACKQDIFSLFPPSTSPTPFCPSRSDLGSRPADQANRNEKPRRGSRASGRSSTGVNGKGSRRQLPHRIKPQGTVQIRIQPHAPTPPYYKPQPAHTHYTRHSFSSCGESTDFYSKGGKCRQRWSHYLLHTWTFLKHR